MYFLSRTLKIIAIAMTIKIATAAPVAQSELKDSDSRESDPDKGIPKEPDPYWYKPCGDVKGADRNDFARDAKEEIGISLNNLRIQHELMLNDYLSRDYEFLYERAKNGVHKHQYIPNWLPGRREIHAVKRLHHTMPEFIVNHLPKLHTDLQKFAVALEEMVKDEVESPRIHDALSTTQSYLQSMLCEVESAINSLPNIEVPNRVERTIMREWEKNPEDDTRRLVRDWGVLLKYKDYLHAWRHVFNY